MGAINHFYKEQNNSYNILILKVKVLYSAFTSSWSHNFMSPLFQTTLFCRFWKMGGPHEVKRLSDTPGGKFHFSGQHLSWNHLCITYRITLIVFLSVTCILNWFLKIPLESVQVEEIRALWGSCLPCPQLMAQIVLLPCSGPSSHQISCPAVPENTVREMPPLTTEKEQRCYVR